ncbi:QueT transporter family protein [Hominifimenecus sp. rT4P-3]|uniref:QueT transporter family protein n=1 Tax=Hominifimenecus sp. rT4P-3 TaxID=3242979 RepID=UPI003DA57E81
MKKEQTVRYMTTAAMIAALYTALTLLFAPFGFGPIQCRISEALVILPYFTPAAIPGVTIGCFLGNLFAGAVPMDVVFGTLASLLGAIGSYALRRHRFWVCVPPIVSNTLIVPWVLKIAYGAPELVPYLMVTVGIGEVIAIGGLGTVLLLGLEKYPMLFRR